MIIFKVRWFTGDIEHLYSAHSIEEGINLAQEFIEKQNKPIKLINKTEFINYLEKEINKPNIRWIYGEEWEIEIMHINKI